MLFIACWFASVCGCQDDFCKSGTSESVVGYCVQATPRVLHFAMQVKEQCEAAGKCDMGGFTRLLHSGHLDELMDEIPSFVANPLPDEGHKGSVPYQQFSQLARRTIPVNDLKTSLACLLIPHIAGCRS